MLAVSAVSGDRLDCWPRVAGKSLWPPLARDQLPVGPSPRNGHPGSGSKECASGIRVQGTGIRDPGPRKGNPGSGSISGVFCGPGRASVHYFAKIHDAD